MHWIRLNQIRSNEKEGNESMFDNEMNASSSTEWIRINSIRLNPIKSNQIRWVRKKLINVWQWNECTFINGMNAIESMFDKDECKFINGMNAIESDQIWTCLIRSNGWAGSECDSIKLNQMKSNQIKWMTRKQCVTMKWMQVHQWNGSESIQSDWIQSNQIRSDEWEKN